MANFLKSRKWNKIVRFYFYFYVFIICDSKSNTIIRQNVQDLILLFEFSEKKNDAQFSRERASLHNSQSTLSLIRRLEL